MRPGAVVGEARYNECRLWEVVGDKRGPGRGWLGKVMRRRAAEWRPVAVVFVGEMGLLTGVVRKVTGRLNVAPSRGLGASNERRTHLGGGGQSEGHGDDQGSVRSCVQARLTWQKVCHWAVRGGNESGR